MDPLGTYFQTIVLHWRRLGFFPRICPQLLGDLRLVLFLSAPQFLPPPSLPGGSTPVGRKRGGETIEGLYQVATGRQLSAGSGSLCVKVCARRCTST